MESRARSKSPKRRNSSTSNRSAIMKQLKKMNEEQLKAAMLKKRECNAKAQRIIERLLDPIHSEEEFLGMLSEINQEHYQNIVEERAIVKLCGFPLCKEELVQIPSQKYHISRCTSTIYDLTERKNFCSGKCLKSSSYIKAQLLTSPLWMRDQEEIPEFKLLRT